MAQTNPNAAIEECWVVGEAPATVVIDDQERFSLLCLPERLDDLAVGFLISEGAVRSTAEIMALELHDLEIRVRLAPAERNRRRRRQLLIASSCGLCGSEGIAELIGQTPAVGDRLRVAPALLQTAQRQLRLRQTIFPATGGTHAAALIDPSGQALGFAEDIGRHNALDKAIGQCCRAGDLPAGCLAALSGRVSFELVSKAAHAGIELIAAVSAPTALAVRGPNRAGITLCCFVREDRATVFSHPHRLRP